MPNVLLSGPQSTRSVRQTFFEIELRSDGIAWLKRTANAYGDLKEVHRAYDQFLEVVDQWLFDRNPSSGLVRTSDPPSMGWLYDLRHASAQRNDPEFEAIIQSRRADLLKRSPLLVVVVKTATGRLQVNRIAASNRGQVHVSDDFDGSVAWLKKELRVDTPSVRSPKL